MNYYVYILHSELLDRYYIGMSKFSSKRLRQHNKKQTYWTSRANDWIEIWHTETNNSVNARILEKKIKSRGADRFLNDIAIAVPPKAE